MYSEERRVIVKSEESPDNTQQVLRSSHGRCGHIAAKLYITMNRGRGPTDNKSKARGAIDLSLKHIAPHLLETLLQAVLHDKDQTAVPDTSSMHSRVKCYNKATSWYTRQQILSIVAKNTTNEQLQVTSLLISVND